MRVKKNTNRRGRNKDKTSVIAISIRNSHLNLTDEFAKNHTLGNRSHAVGHIIGKFFDAKDKDGEYISIQVEQNTFPLSVVAAIIGLGVDIDSVVRCLLAWLKHESLPDQLAFEASDLTVRTMAVVKENGGYEQLLDACRKHLSIVYDTYWFNRSNHLSLFHLTIDKWKTSNTPKAIVHVAEKIESLESMEVDAIAVLCSLSSEIRFATLIALQEGVLTTYPEMPDWVQAAETQLRDMDEY